MRLNVDQMLQTTPASRLTAAIKRSRSDHLRTLNSPVAGLLDPLAAPRLALRLTRDNQGVYLQDLCVSGLARTRLAKSVHDVGWAILVRLLEERRSGTSGSS
jgi:transposase